MPKVMPQEIEVWYVIPAIRKELAKVFVHDFQLSQKQTAKVLGITEAAISQYLNQKRASELQFTASDMEDVRKTADKIMRNKEHAMQHIYELCVKMRGSKCVCELHRKHEKDLPAECSICKVK
ncbi:hypothetical protein J4464_05505 [Candidatus Woesearchaeota archaeon]|nr:hypothetical protein [Candidatus Woesearchaeota archaeon]